ncbi:MAG: ribosome maturation factor RimP [Thermodesulfobacteriota bacterium]
MRPDELEVVQRVTDLAEPVLKEEGLELVEAQYRRERGGYVLRLFIDRAAGSGVTLDDCVQASRELGRLLDVEEVIAGPYTLEVSSPGLDRPLRRPADFHRFAGRLVRVRTAAPEGRRTIKGRLLGLRDGRIELEAEGRRVSVLYEEAKSVRLEPEINFNRAS